MSYKKEIEELINKDFESITKTVIPINSDIPIFNKEDFEVIEGTPKYFGVDKYGRIIGAVALISKNTLPIITEKELEYPRPYGWTKNLEKIKRLFESCHILAYNLSAQTTDKENLFIGTNDLNTSIMKKIENKVNKEIRDNDLTVLYKVTMKYQRKNQIPTGILIEAQSVDKKFSICQFCYNVEKQIKFDYSDGTVIYNNRLLDRLVSRIKKENNIEQKKFSNNKNKISKTRLNYILNIKTNECHYSRDCENLKNVKTKYIQGTRTTEQVITDNNFKICNKCKIS